MRRKQSGRASRRCGLLGLAVVAGAPDIDHDQRRVVDAVLLLERGLELRARQHGLFALDLLVDGHGRLHAGDVLPVGELAVGQRHRRLVTGVGGVIEEHRERLPRDGWPLRPIVNELLGRLLEADGDEPRGRRDLAGVLEDGDGQPHFVGGERFERVRGGGHDRPGVKAERWRKFTRLETARQPISRTRGRLPAGPVLAAGVNPESGMAARPRTSGNRRGGDAGTPGRCTRSSTAAPPARRSAAAYWPRRKWSSPTTACQPG